MLRAMYSGVSGMAAHMTKLNVIGNNIANANTYGFKSSRVVFTDVLYQNLSSSAAGTAESGGINASQMGYGAKVGTIDVNNSVSSGADTGRALDVYINGEGYIPVKTNEGTIRYTRVGDLRFDTDGNLTDGSGSRILGIPKDENNNNKPILETDGTIKIENLAAINVAPTDLEKCTGISIGPNGEITGIQQSAPTLALNSKAVGLTALKETATSETSISETSDYTGDVSMSVYKAASFSASLTGVTLDRPMANLGTGDLTITRAGSTYTLTGLKRDGTTPFSVTGVSDGTNVTFDVDSDKKTDITIPVASCPADGTSDTLGTIEVATDTTVSAIVFDKGGTSHTLTATWDGAATPPATTLTLTGANTDSITMNVDAAKFATIGTLDGAIVGAVKTDDAPVVLGYIAITKFANPDGLSREGDGYYSVGANSGDPVAAMAGSAGTGSLKSSSLEMSNVDIAAEFTEMITAQRGFQANTRLITVSDSILEELINLKR